MITREKYSYLYTSIYIRIIEKQHFTHQKRSRGEIDFHTRRAPSIIKFQTREKKLQENPVTGGAYGRSRKTVRLFCDFLICWVDGGLFMAMEVVLRALNDARICGAKRKHHLSAVFAFSGEETQVPPRPQQEQITRSTDSGLLNK